MRLFLYKCSLGRVHDLLEARETGERLFLRVDADAFELARLINSLADKLTAITGDDMEAAEAQAGEVAREFCTAIFGKAQTDKIFDLYNHDVGAVLGFCCKYYNERLWKKITRAQKRKRA